MSCGIGRRCGSDPSLLWLWGRPAAVAPIRPLAWELPCATLKKKKQGCQGTPLSHPPREDPATRQGCLWTRNQALTRPWIHHTFILNFPASRTTKNKYLLFKPPSLLLCYSSLKKSKYYCSYYYVMILQTYFIKISVLGISKTENTNFWLLILVFIQSCFFFITLY